MDPLKPFATIVRSIWDKAAKRVDDVSKASSTASATERNRADKAASVDAIQSFHNRLRTRLVNLGAWDATTARHLFVECALVSELGMELENDPLFSGVVRRVGDALGTDEKLSGRLDQLLKRLAAGEVIG